MAESLVTSVALPFSLTHIWTHSLDMPCQVNHRCEHSLTFPTLKTIYRNENITNLAIFLLYSCTSRGRGEGGTYPMSSTQKVSLNRPFALKLPHKGSKIPKMSCFRSHILFPALEIKCPRCALAIPIHLPLVATKPRLQQCNILNCKRLMLFST